MDSVEYIEHVAHIQQTNHYHCLQSRKCHSNSTASFLTLHASSFALATVADSGGMTSVIDMAVPLAVIGAAGVGLEGVEFAEGARTL